MESYPIFHALSYEFWAYANLHPVATVLMVFLVISLIGWLVEKS